jgi:hypothetical protein
MRLLSRTGGEGSPWPEVSGRPVVQIATSSAFCHVHILSLGRSRRYLIDEYYVKVLPLVL